MTSLSPDQVAAEIGGEGDEDVSDVAEWPAVTG
jgi:hypothetical protein